jgi:geranylgeranyl diphosphate synthase type I
MAETDGIRERVEERLRRFFDDKREEAAALAPESTELVEAIFELTLRGGKRLRARVAAAAFRSVRSDGDIASTVDVGAAIEMLQTFLLVHDDWMDCDEERRGGPSVWAALRDRHGDPHLGASLAILAGDLAAVYAQELLVGAPFPEEKRGPALDAFHRMQREVFFGQQLDLVASRDVERMYDLKTGSYTVTRGPSSSPGSTASPRRSGSRSSSATSSSGRSATLRSPESPPAGICARASGPC